MKTEEKFDLIERYLKNEMEATKRKQFEKQLESDQELAESLEQYKLTDLAIDIYHKEELKGELLVKGKRMLSAYKRRRQALGAVATIVLLIGAFFITRFYINRPDSGTQDDPQQIFAQYFNLVDLSEFQTLSIEDQVWQSVIDAYQAGDCEEVIEEVSNLLQDASLTKKNEAHLLLGTCYLNIDSNGARALIQFGNISQNAIAYYRHGQWYTALAYIKSGQTAEAKILIDSIVQVNSHPYREKAAALGVIINDNRVH